MGESGAIALSAIVAQAEDLLRQDDASAALMLLRDCRTERPPHEQPYLDRLIGRALLDLNRRSEAYATLQAALADPMTSQDDALHAALLNLVGIIYDADERFQAAIEAYGRALYYDDRADPPDHSLRARLLTNMGIAAFKAGQVEASTIYYERAIEAARRAHDALQLGQAHMGLGMARKEAHDYTAALSHAAQAMTQFEKAAEPRLVAQALTNLALVHAEQEQWDKAVPHLQSILSRAQADGDMTAESHALELLARARAFAGDHLGAVQFAAQARATAERIDDRLEANVAALTEAAALTALGRATEAEDRFQAAIAYFHSTGSSRRLMDASQAYARALRAWGRIEEALEVLDRAYTATVNLRQG